MYVNYDFMHPCFSCRFMSESSIHIEQTLKPVSNLSLWQFVSFLDEVSHVKLNKCRCSRLFSAGTLRKIKQQRHQVPGNVRLHAVPQTAGVLSCDRKRGSLTVIHSNHWTIPPPNTAEGLFFFTECQSSRSVQTRLCHSQID